MQNKLQVLEMVRTRAEELVEQCMRDEQDVEHHAICCVVCDEQDLWNRGRNGKFVLPMSVMYIVSGVLREHGIS